MTTLECFDTGRERTVSRKCLVNMRGDKTRLKCMHRRLRWKERSLLDPSLKPSAMGKSNEFFCCGEDLNDFNKLIDDFAVRENETLPPRGKLLSLRGQSKDADGKNVTGPHPPTS